MNRTGTLLTLLFATAILMAVAACTPREETYDRTIMRAERLTDTNPYGALTLLNGRKDSLCASPADSALFELVYTEAVHDLGVTLANSAYIERSADYFRQCGDRRRRARALVQTAKPSSTRTLTPSMAILLMTRVTALPARATNIAWSI